MAHTRKEGEAKNETRSARTSPQACTRKHPYLNRPKLVKTPKLNLPVAAEEGIKPLVAQPARHSHR